MRKFAICKVCKMLSFFVQFQKMHQISHFLFSKLKEKFTLESKHQILKMNLMLKQRIFQKVDLIPSPSGSCEHLIFFFSFLWPKMAGYCQQTLLNKKIVVNNQQYFAFTPQANFPAHNLKVKGLSPDYLLKSFSL